jgi:hypothetical protein
VAHPHDHAPERQVGLVAQQREGVPAGADEAEREHRRDREHGQRAEARDQHGRDRQAQAPLAAP